MPVPSRLAAEPLADDAALRTYLWKSEGVAVRPGRAHPGRRARRPTLRCGRRGGRPRLRSGAAPARAAARAVARAPAAAAVAPGGRRSQPAASCWRARAAASSPVVLATSRAGPRQPCHEPATSWRICRVRCGWPSFLWPWSSPICGRWSGRAAIVLRTAGRDRAADARVEDCRGALARPHLTPRGARGRRSAQRLEGAA